ncbi:DUF1934 family protein [Ignavigranum ruoffiae]|uniref:DUF1934 family protein n=1 Tax=Ignavigranum ruoffiae TaxID=89093 RepID=UPI0023548353|nr:DUF1934 family protein [Ignavigranum ruoffiae]
MKHLIRPIEVEQKINYQAEGQDSFKYQRTAQHYQLRTYDKLVFEDYNHQPIQIKWWTEGEDQLEWVEIQQQAGKLCFNLAQKLTNPYQTPQGVWLLESSTHKLDLSQGIEIHYSLNLGQQSLGIYEFQLIFKD